jgi:hypothetical protein
LEWLNFWKIHRSRPSKLGHQGFWIITINANPEFQPLQEKFRFFNLCAQGEHVPEVERYIRTVKDWTCSRYYCLPFKYIPQLMLVRLAHNAIFWLNAFPYNNGVSDSMSPRYMIVGRWIDFKKHVRLEFGSYLQTHAEHSNDTQACTIGVICLEPTRNEEGGHYFMSLMTRHWL